MFNEIVEFLKDMLAFFLEIYNRIAEFIDQPTVDISKYVK